VRIPGLLTASTAGYRLAATSKNLIEALGQPRASAGGRCIEERAAAGTWGSWDLTATGGRAGNAIPSGSPLLDRNGMSHKGFSFTTDSFFDE
jgi:hypothetical protein